MMDNRQSAEKVEKPGRSKGNLGQKQAAREERAEEELEHMGNGKSSGGQQSKTPKKREK
jgi:hypothetical protein